MRILSPIVLVLPTFVMLGKTNLVERRAKRPQLVGDVPLGHEALSLEQHAHELEGCFLVALWLDEDVQDRAFAIDCTPEIHPLSTDGDKHFVEVPPIIGSWSEASELVRIFSSELEHPPPDRFIRYVETSLGQPIFHVSEAQREPAIEPNGVLDDFSREAVAPIRDPFHRRRLVVCIS